MAWPLSQDYNEAIQDPGNSFSDAELKAGEAVTNALGIPMPRSGNFADVYEMRCPSGARWAVKCFTREVHGLRERYAEISKYLKQVNLPFMVDFQYLEQGIRIRGQWYPILKMQWVEGFVLNEFVRDNLDKKPILQALGQIWLRMARRLREAKLAHCDLQHGNVMFVPGSNANSLAVKLIDYDGMCVPSLAGKKSGEVGHPAYQHPERLRTGAYNQEMDRFSLLSIAAALRCLTIGGRSLWERYDTGDNLLFRQSDLQAPKASPLFQELLAIPDPQAQTLVKELQRACQGSLAKVPLLTEVVPEEKLAGKGTKTVSAASFMQQSVEERGADWDLSNKGSVEEPGADWDFSKEEPDASIIKRRRKRRGTSMSIWGVMGCTAAVVLVFVGLGLSLFLLMDPDGKKKMPIGGIKPSGKIPNSKWKNPAHDGEPSEPPKEVQFVESQGAKTLESNSIESQSQSSNDGVPSPSSDPTNDAGSPTQPADEQIAGWDRPVDPDGDCQFREERGKLTITLPKNTLHDLSKRGKMNSPRLLRDLDLTGDFRAELHVGGDFPQRESRAGLLLKVDERTYLRLERGRFGPNHVYLWELRRDGKTDRFPSVVMLAAPMGYVGMERRGNEVFGLLRDDGQTWRKLKPFSLDLPQKVKIGVAAVSSTLSDFTATFDGFRLKQGNGEWVHIDWPSLPAPANGGVTPNSPRRAR